MLKMALFDSAINAKCWSVALFSLPTLRDLIAQESLPPGICHPRPKKNDYARGSAWELGGAGRS